MPKTIIVDIDNTLWDLAPELWKHLQISNPQMPPPERWTDWDFWAEHVRVEDLYRALREIHMQQDLYIPYPQSRYFLAALKERGYYIIIASHREKGTLDPTVRWLNRYEMAFDEIHLSRDKSVLFDRSWAIVDDSPVTLEKAATAGIVRAGLRNPWNEWTNHPLFDNLGEVLAYIDSKRQEEKPVRA